MEQEQSASAPAVVSERWVEEVKLIQEVAPEATWEEAHGYLEVTIPAERLVAVGFALRDRLQYQYLSSVTAVDWLEHFELLYHIYRLDRGEAVVLHVNLPRVEEPWIDSVTQVWPGANFQEREVYDLMGIHFAGHPDLRRILLSDDFPGHPLRKDFVIDPEYVRMRHLATGSEGQSLEEHR